MGGGGGRDKIRSFIYTGIIFVKKIFSQMNLSNLRSRQLKLQQLY